MHVGSSEILTLPRDALPLRIRPSHRVSDDELYALCRANPELRIERTAEGEIIVMAPTGGETGRRNAELGFAIMAWARKDGTGVCFDSSTEFVLPNGAGRSPDASWVRRDRWEALSKRDRERFPPLCPDFVVELKSPSDELHELHEKLREYMENGASLGWLIDPETRRVWIYRAHDAIELLEDPREVSGEPLLRGLTVAMSPIW